MKMITAIVNKKDAMNVCEALAEAGFSLTKMASTGGLLTGGNLTVMIGLEDDKVDEAIGIIRTHSKPRTAHVSHKVRTAAPKGVLPSKVTVGGATVFVCEVDRFQKL